MTLVTTIRLLLGVSALTLMAGGAWLAVLGGSEDGAAVTSPGEETSAPSAGSMTAIAQPTATSAATAPVEQRSASATAASAPSAPIAARPTAPTPIPAPTISPEATDLPTMTANEVLDLAREVRLRSGRTFEACGATGPEGEPWPFSVHLYYIGRGGWVVATHRGDASLLFDEGTRRFELDTIARAGC